MLKKAFYTKCLLPLISLFFLAGCAVAPVALLPAAVPAIITGAGGGISYTFTNIAYKTTTHPISEVAGAVVLTIEKMSLKTVWVERKDNKIEFKAATRKLTIYITLEEMTPTLTMITVNAKHHLILKDKTTAFEVIFQTDIFLSRAIGPAEKGRSL